MVHDEYIMTGFILKRAFSKAHELDLEGHSYTKTLKCKYV